LQAETILTDAIFIASTKYDKSVIFHRHFIWFIVNNYRAVRYTVQITWQAGHRKRYIAILKRNVIGTNFCNRSWRYAGPALAQQVRTDCTGYILF